MKFWQSANFWHAVYSCVFWIVLVTAIVLCSSGVESKFIYTDF
ncbi:hypothetical protein [Alicyclobacillus contaminans]|nr:hypothetical protein [Alicyclobacillus contaminans]